MHSFKNIILWFFHTALFVNLTYWGSIWILNHTSLFFLSNLLAYFALPILLLIVFYKLIFPFINNYLLIHIHLDSDMNEGLFLGPAAFLAMTWFLYFLVIGVVLKVPDKIRVLEKGYVSLSITDPIPSNAVGVVFHQARLDPENGGQFSRNRSKKEGVNTVSYTEYLNLVPLTENKKYPATHSYWLYFRYPSLPGYANAVQWLHESIKNDPIYAITIQNSNDSSDALKTYKQLTKNKNPDSIPVFLELALSPQLAEIEYKTTVYLSILFLNLIYLIFPFLILLIPMKRFRN